VAAQANAGREAGVRISTDPTELDLDWLTAALGERAFWAIGRPREVIEASIRGSLCFGAFVAGRQVGFARVVTDEATFGWVCDVFVGESERGSGVGQELMSAIVSDPRLAGCRLALASRDARSLYERFGFVPLRHLERWLERPRPDRAPQEDAPS
jgi:GNAT superfamily N-acetyltransferase